MAVAPVRLPPPSTSQPLEPALPPWRCVFRPRARLRRASRRPPGFDRAEFASDRRRECSGRVRERKRRRARSAHEDSTRGSPRFPGATQPSGGKTSFARSRRRPGRIATRARARRPIEPRVFSPEVSSALRARDWCQSRLEDAVRARGDSQPPAQRPPISSVAPLGAHFLARARLPEPATDRRSDRPSLSTRRSVVSPLSPATIPPRAISSMPPVSSSRSSRRSRRGRISSTTTTSSSRCVPRRSARPSPDYPPHGPAYPI